MKSQRLLKVAEFIDKLDSVIDVGCDHAYLAIYLKQKKNVKNVIASDINSTSLKIAQKNIKKYNLEKDILLYQSNGLKDIPLSTINTVIIAGMGSHTMIEILKNANLKRIKKIVLASNNDYEYLREEMKKLSYSLMEEAIVFEKNHYYFIMKYKKGNQDLSKKQLKYGLYLQNSSDYYEYLYQENKKVLKQIPWFKWKIRHEKKLKLKELKEILKEKRQENY